MKRIFTVLSLLFTVSAALAASSVTLAWDPNCDTAVTGYNLYYGLTNNVASTNIVTIYTNDCGVVIPTSTNIYHGAYTNVISVVGRTNNNCTVSNLISGNTYFFVVTSTSTNGLESAYSQAEVSYTVPFPYQRPTNVVNLLFKK